MHMAAQEIYLTPRNIISHLQVIEAKVPRREFSFYVPILNPSSPTDVDLVVETKSMLDFVGLTGYQANVRFSSLEKGVGGNIHLGSSFDKSVNINVDEKYRPYWKACVAILAHEICHKVLQVYDLTSPTTLMNEVYTDLTTIYVGFGQLILNGYITYTSGCTQYLGYLKFDTYKVTHLLVCVVYGQMPGEATGQLHTDVMAEEAVKLWESEKDHISLLKKIFVERGQQNAKLHKNILLLEQIIKHCKLSLYHEAEQLETQLYTNTPLSGDRRSNLLSAFASVYDYCANLQEDGSIRHNPKIDSLNESIGEALFNMFLTYSEMNGFQFNYSVTCPFCGNSFQDSRVDGSTVIETCPSCRHHFVYNGTRWNPTIRQRELKEAKAERQRKFEKEVNEAKDAIQRKTNIEIERIKADAEARVVEIRRNELMRCKKSIRKSIPKILLPFVKKYLR